MVASATIVGAAFCHRSKEFIGIKYVNSGVNLGAKYQCGCKALTAVNIERVEEPACLQRCGML
eukprot:365443-Chlamydomonas_euryale.AAC.24